MANQVMLRQSPPASGPRTVLRPLPHAPMVQLSSLTPENLGKRDLYSERWSGEVGYIVSFNHQFVFVEYPPSLPTRKILNSTLRGSLRQPHRSREALLDLLIRFREQYHHIVLLAHAS